MSKDNHLQTTMKFVHGPSDPSTPQNAAGSLVVWGAWLAGLRTSS